MKVGRLLSPVHSLGPGERIGLWTQGCSRKCEGCISPELQEISGKDIHEEALSKIIIQVADKNNCDGITISGGDPFEQADALLRLLKHIRNRFKDILVYTGFTLDEIQEGKTGKSGIECLEFIDVLIDGRYHKELNTPDCVLRGSSNQNIYYFNECKRELYTDYMHKGRIVETFEHNNDMIIVGILNEVGK